MRVELDLTPHLRPGGNELWIEGGDPDVRVRAVWTDLAGELSGPWTISGGVVGEPGDVHIDTSALQAAVRWAPWAAGEAGSPRLYRAHFDLPSTDGAVPLHLQTDGLAKGVAWVNGHHLGRHWEIGPQRASFIPPCWLAGHNELLLFDEEGRSPNSVTLVQSAAVLMRD